MLSEEALQEVEAVTLEVRAEEVVAYTAEDTEEVTYRETGFRETAPDQDFGGRSEATELTSVIQEAEGSAVVTEAVREAVIRVEVSEDIPESAVTVAAFLHPEDILEVMVLLGLSTEGRLQRAVMT